ncbi:MAG TPA: hypothetical protein VGC78_08940 [Gaiellaceae bacterium]|jgi:hypothetical protein
MTRIHRSLLVAVVAALASLVAGPVGAQADAGGKVTVCHGTASVKNPYVVITVGSSAVPALLAGGGQRKNDDVVATDGSCTPDQGGTF